METFVQLDDISLAIRAENIECVEVIGEGKNEWALAVHVRGRYEPYKLLGNQLHLARLYNILLDYLGGVKKIETGD